LCDVTLLEALLGKGVVKTSVLDADGASPLLQAVKCENMAVTKLLLGAGADVNIETRPCNPLVAAIRGNNGAMVELLLRDGAIPSSQALRTACSDGNVPILEALIDYGARLDHLFQDSCPHATHLTILHVSKGYEVKKWILERAPDLINAVPIMG
jgi:ankyrin repeat protein